MVDKSYKKQYIVLHALSNISFSDLLPGELIYPCKGGGKRGRWAAFQSVLKLVALLACLWHFGKKDQMFRVQVDQLLALWKKSVLKGHQDRSNRFIT